MAEAIGDGTPPGSNGPTPESPAAGALDNGQAAMGHAAIPSRLLRSSRRIPEATVARLPVYLRCLLEVVDAKTPTISSERLAEMAGVNAAKVRKDLSYLGSYGTRGVGYDVEYLFLHINRVLGLTQDWPVVIVGVGNLGHALANYGGFSARGFRIVALLDADRNRVGEMVGRRRRPPRRRPARRRRRARHRHRHHRHARPSRPRTWPTGWWRWA